MGESVFSANNVKQRTSVSDYLEREGPFGYLMVLPAAVFIVIMLGYPFILAVYLSFTNKQIGQNPEFAGLRNFVLLAEDPLFWTTVRNSFVYTGFALALKFVGGLGLALLLNQNFHGKRLARAVLLLPWIVPTVFSTLIWWWMLDPSFGIFNVALKQWGWVQGGIPFLINPFLAMSSLILVNVWRGIPFFAIVLLAGLQTIPEELIDASRIDGAKNWQTLLYVTLPLMAPVIAVLLLITTIGTIADFELPFLLTRGGPGNATTTFGILSYNLSTTSGLYGLGTAVTMTMFPILALIVIRTLGEIRQSN